MSKKLALMSFGWLMWLAFIGALEAWGVVGWTAFIMPAIGAITLAILALAAAISEGK